MRIEQIRVLSDDQLAEELEKNRRALMNLRFRVATRQLANINELRLVKQDVARMITIIRERQLAGGIT